MICPKTDTSDESREAVEFPDSLKAQNERGAKRSILVITVMTSDGAVFFASSLY